MEGKITKNEFLNYYYNVSAACDRDDYFEIVIRNAWHFSGMESWSSNSANPRFRQINSRNDGTDFIDDNGPRTLENLIHDRKGPNNNGVYGPRSSFERTGSPRNSPRSSPGRSMSPSGLGRTSSPPPASYFQGRTDRPLNF